LVVIMINNIGDIDSVCSVVDTLSVLSKHMIDDSSCIVLLSGKVSSEVHIWRRVPKHYRDTGDYTHVWKYPSTEEFGNYGWCFGANQESRAKAYYDMLVERYSSCPGVIKTEIRS